jgi:hypothetical protein
MYSSNGFSFFGRPRLAIQLLYQQKRGERKIFLDKPLFWGYSNYMNRLNREKQVQVLKCLIDGMSIRATVRLTGAAKDTVTQATRCSGKRLC